MQGQPDSEEVATWQTPPNTLIVVSQLLDHLAIRADRLMVIDKREIEWDGDPRRY
jgi:energy-coupling factor transporter ATP-binding protein EcfA2